MKDLLEKWTELKKVERNAKEEREQVEVELFLALKGDMNEESQSTWNFDEYKLVIKPNFTVSVDQEMAASNDDLFKIKYEMSYAQYKKSEYKSVVESMITIKQSKPTFTVELK
jgi:hypothetical protein